LAPDTAEVRILGVLKSARTLADLGVLTDLFVSLATLESGPLRVRDLETAVVKWNETYRGEAIPPGTLVLGLEDAAYVYAGLDGVLQVATPRPEEPSGDILARIEILAELGRRGVSVKDSVFDVSLKIEGLTVAVSEPLARLRDSVFATKSILLETRHVVVFESDGGVFVVPNEIDYAPIEIPPENRSLSKEKIEDLFVLNKLFAGEIRYSQFAGPLSLLAHARLTGERFRETRATYLPEVSELLAAGGDCMEMSVALQSKIQSELGITSLIVGQCNDGNIKISNPVSHAPQDMPWPKGLDYVCGVTHMDLLIPYTDDAGAEMAVHLITGMGVDDKYVEGPMPFSDMMTHLEKRKFTVNHGHITNPGWVIAQKSSIKGNIKLHQPDMSEKKLMGMDFIQGTIYLNRKASETSDVPMPPGYRDAGSEPVRISVCYRDLLKDPDRMITLEFLRDGGPVHEAISHRDYLTLLVTKLSDEFALPKETAADILMMMDTDVEYIQDVLRPPARYLVEIEPMRKSVMDQMSRLPADFSQRLALNRLFAQAGRLIMEGKPADAEKCYQNILDRIRDIPGAEASSVPIVDE